MTASGEDDTLTGGCLCGAVRFKVRPPFGLVEHCHCSRCRRAYGAAFSTNAAVPADAFSITAGQELLGEYAPTEGRRKGFCSRCGSPLFIRRLGDAPKVAVALGTLDQDPGARPERHVFVDSKAPWHAITDELPRYPFYPGAAIGGQAQAATPRHPLHHVSLGVADLARTARFYDAALMPLGLQRVWSDATALGYGRPGGGDALALKLQPTVTAPPGSGFHLALAACHHAAVQAFHAAALAHGGQDNGGPGWRPAYGPHYFAAFVIDPDGHRLEAVVNRREPPGRSGPP